MRAAKGRPHKSIKKIGKSMVKAALKIIASRI